MLYRGSGNFVAHATGHGPSAKTNISLDDASPPTGGCLRKQLTHSTSKDIVLTLATMYRYRSFISKLNFLFDGRQVHTRKYCRDFKFAVSPCQQSKLRNRHYKLANHLRRFSVASEAHHDSFLQTDLLTFVKSTLHNPEGPNHCWLNGIGGSTKSNQDGILLLLIILSIKDLEIVGNRQHARGFQLAKLVQQRHPDVNIIIVCSGLLDAISDTAWIIKAVMEEFITFPILVLKKDFLQMSDHVGFLLCQGSIDHVVHLSGHNEIAVISKDTWDLCRNASIHY